MIFAAFMTALLGVGIIAGYMSDLAPTVLDVAASLFVICLILLGVALVFG